MLEGHGQRGDQADPERLHREAIVRLGSGGQFPVVPHLRGGHQDCQIQDQEFSFDCSGVGKECVGEACDNDCVCTQDYEVGRVLRLLLVDLEGGQLGNIVDNIVLDDGVLLSKVVHVHVLQTSLVVVDGEQLSPQEASTGASLKGTGPGGSDKVLEDRGQVGFCMMDLLVMILMKGLAAKDIEVDEECSGDFSV